MNFASPQLQCLHAIFMRDRHRRTTSHGYARLCSVVSWTLYGYGISSRSTARWTGTRLVVLMSGTVFVALLCTRSIASMSRINLGFHITLPYSSIGLTLEVKSCINLFVSMFLKLRLIIPTTWFAFTTVLLMCWLKVNLLSTTTPRSFSITVSSSCIIVPSSAVIV